MNIQFNRTNPAIARFSAMQQQDDARRAQEEASFRQRFQDDQASGVDRAIRAGFKPEPQPVAPVRQAQVQPSAQAAPPVQVTALPDQEPITVRPLGPEEPTVPQGAPPIAAMTASPVPAPEPAPSVPAQTQQPAIAGASTTQRPNRYARVMDELSRTPGGGAAMMQIDQRAQAEDVRSQQMERQKQAAEIAAMRAMHNAEPDIAHAIAQKYGLNLPPEFIKNKRAQQEMSQLGTLIKQTGVTDDNAAMQITRNYLDARKGGMDTQAALQGAFNGVQAAPKAAAGVREVYDQNRGVWVKRPDDQNPNGQVLSPPGQVPRNYSPNSAAANRDKLPSAIQVLREKEAMFRRLNPGATDQQVSDQVFKGGNLTPAQALSAWRAIKGNDFMNKMTPDQVEAAVNAAVGIANRASRGASGAPAGRGTGGSPYAEGTRLRGKDGSTYTVKGGVPVKD